MAYNFPLIFRENRLEKKRFKMGIFFTPTQNSTFTKIGPLAFSMVIIFFPKVNNAIPDRFLMFLSCQNYFFAL